MSKRRVLFCRNKKIIKFFLKIILAIKNFKKKKNTIRFKKALEFVNNLK
jgi:hypothetical protein